MPRRSIPSAPERGQLLALPDTPQELIRQYTFSEADLSLIRQHRGAPNRLGFAVQLCYLRFPGTVLRMEEEPLPPLLAFIATQLKLSGQAWALYGQREQTRREHLLELQMAFGFQTFTVRHYRESVRWLTEVALQTDKGLVLLRALLGHLRRQTVLLPAMRVLERLSAEATTRANRQLYHESELRIEEHYTDTAGFTDHLFGLMPLLSYRFAPRIRDLSDTKLLATGSGSIRRAQTADWWHTQHTAHSGALGGDSAPSRFHQARHCHRLADAAQARQPPAPEWAGRSPARIGTVGAEPVCPGLATERGTAPPRTGRAQQRGGPQRARACSQERSA